MEKKVKKKVKIKVLPFLIALIVIVILFFLYRFVVSLPIKNIYIIGNSILSDQEIIEIIGIRDYPSFVKTTKKQIKSNLMKNDYIDDVKVKKSFFNQITIEIDEAKALFTDGENILVLSNKKKVENNKNIIVPTLINYTPDTKYEALIEKMSKVNSDILVQISEIMYEPTEQDKDRFKLYMNDGNIVYLTLTKFNMIDYYDSIVSELECKKGILNLDSGNHFETKIDNCN